MAQPVAKPFLRLLRITTAGKSADGTESPAPKLALSFDGIPANVPVQATLLESDGTGGGERRPDRELG